MRFDWLAIGLATVAIAATSVAPASAQVVSWSAARNPAASNEFDDLIVQHARLNGVRPDLVRAVIQVESGFNPLARSPKGAMGLMQLMPATAEQFGVRNPFNPGENVRAGVRYLRLLLDRYSDNEELALAAYNAGPGEVDKHGEAVPPFAETKQYVARVTGLAGLAALRVSTPQTYRIVQVVDGREQVLYSNKPDAQITQTSLLTSRPDARTLAQVLQSSSVFRAP